MTAVVAVVVFTFSAQYSSLGYVFGILAVLTAAGMLIAYIKALPGAETSEQKPQIVEPVRQLESAEQREALVRAVREDLYRKHILTERDRSAQTFESLIKERLSERRLRISISSDFKVGSYYTQIKFHHREPVNDRASVIINIIERLCVSSKEPRFEFILAPDGSFKIQQVSLKRSAIEHLAEQEELVEQVKEADEPQVVM